MCQLCGNGYKRYDSFRRHQRSVDKIIIWQTRRGEYALAKLSKAIMRWQTRCWQTQRWQKRFFEEEEK